MMAWKPWYEQLAEMDNVSEQQEFMRGVFGFRPKDKQPIIAGLIGGYIGAKVATKAKKRKWLKNSIKPFTDPA